MTLLLTTVLANPHDPMRGALSDHWAEYGVPPVVLPCGQAIEPTDPRVAYQPGDAVPWGFRCTMAEWCGGGRCPRDMDRDGTCYYMCNVCRGTGRIPGIAAAVCGAWPITGVELTDFDISESHAALLYGRRAAGLPDLQPLPLVTS